MRFTKRIVTQGQITMPTDLRDALGIRPGDLVEFEIVGIVRRKTSPLPDPFTSELPVPQ